MLLATTGREESVSPPSHLRADSERRVANGKRWAGSRAPLQGCKLGHHFSQMKSCGKREQCKIAGLGDNGVGLWKPPKRIPRHAGRIRCRVWCIGRLVGINTHPVLPMCVPSQQGCRHQLCCRRCCCLLHPISSGMSAGGPAPS